MMRLLDKLRTFRIKLFGLLFVGLVVFLGAAIYLPYWRPSYWESRATLEEVKAALLAQGHPVAFSDLEQDDELGSQLGAQAESILKRIKDMNWDTREAIRSDPPWSSNDRELLLAAIEDHRDVMREFADLDPIAECRFSHDFRVASPMSTLLPMVEGVTQISCLWRAQALISSQDSKYDLAFRSAIAMSNTAESLAGDPFLVSQFVRARGGGECMDTLEAILGDAAPNAEQFQALDAQLAKMEASFRLCDTIRAEGASLFTSLENVGHPDVRESLEMMGGLDSGGSLFSFSPKQPAMNTWSSLSYLPELMQQQVWTLRVMSQAAELVDQPGEAATQEWETINREISKKLSSEGPVSHLFPAIANLRDQAFAYRQRLQATRLALRVVRYRQRKGEFPNGLDDVLDPQLPAIPPSLWTGKRPDFEYDGHRLTISYHEGEVDEEQRARVSIELPPG